MGAGRREPAGKGRLAPFPWTPSGHGLQAIFPGFHLLSPGVWSLQQPPTFEPMEEELDPPHLASWELRLPTPGTLIPLRPRTPKWEKVLFNRFTARLGPGDAGNRWVICPGLLRRSVVWLGTQTPGPPQEPHSQHLSPQGPQPTRLVRGLWQIFLLDRHWGGGTQEASRAGAQARQGWPCWGGGDVMGWWGWLWRLLLLLLLIHFALLGPPVLEPDLHLWGQRTEMGQKVWRLNDRARGRERAVELLFLDVAFGASLRLQLPQLFMYREHVLPFWNLLPCLLFFFEVPVIFFLFCPAKYRSCSCSSILLLYFLIFIYF